MWWCCYTHLGTPAPNLPHLVGTTTPCRGVCGGYRPREGPNHCQNLKNFQVRARSVVPKPQLQGAVPVPMGGASYDAVQHCRLEVLGHPPIQGTVLVGCRTPHADLAPSLPNWHDPLDKMALRDYDVTMAHWHGRRPRNPDSVRAHETAGRLRRRYGVSVVWYLAQYQHQNGQCAACGQPDNTRRLSLDHDHDTGQPRELLCGQCNLIAVEPDRVDAVANYLRRHRTRGVTPALHQPRT